MIIIVNKMQLPSPVELSAVPLWMTSYIEWHQKIRPTINANTFTAHKYLVMFCYRRRGLCGGLSDRIKYVPLAMCLASLSQRMLFIRWDSPAPLEEFLVPTPHGLDWRLTRMCSRKSIII
jgi:hypothetical protein